MSASRSGDFPGRLLGLLKLEFQSPLFLGHLVEDLGDGPVLIRVLCEGQILGDQLPLPRQLRQGCLFHRNLLVEANVVSIPLRELTEPLLELGAETRGQ